MIGAGCQCWWLSICSNAPSILRADVLCPTSQISPLWKRK